MEYEWKDIFFPVENDESDSGLLFDRSFPSEAARDAFIAANKKSARESKAVNGDDGEDSDLTRPPSE